MPRSPRHDLSDPFDQAAEVMTRVQLVKLDSLAVREEKLFDLDGDAQPATADLLPDMRRTPEPPQTTSSLNCASGSFRESMQSLISRTLEDTGWIIGGPDGAAARLGQPRTSLLSKMKKLGIFRPENKNMTNIRMISLP